MNPKVSLVKVIESDGQMRLDLVIENMPKKFLGLATDLVFDNPAALKQFDRFEFGPVFNLIEGENKPFFLTKAEDDRLVFGMAQKGNQLQKLEDGIVGMFYFQQPLDFKLGFEHAVLSLFDQGRMDVEEVEWSSDLKNIDYRMGDFVPELPEAEIGEETLIEQEFFEDFYSETESVLTDDLKAEMLAWNPEAGKTQQIDWVLIGVGVTLSMLVAAGLYWRHYWRLKNQHSRNV